MSFNYDNDVEDLLEKSIDENYSQNNYKQSNKCPFKPKPKYSNRMNKKVFTVEEKVKFNPLLLPDGWVRLYHESGMFFYCHANTRVVTWSMPYQLQTEPHRYHRVPVRALPCLSFKFANNSDTDLLTSSENRQNNEAADASTVASETEHDMGENKNSILQSILIKENEDLPGVGDVNETITELPEKEDMEDGELESSDEEKHEKDGNGQKNNRNEIGNLGTGLVLPKQYQIESNSRKNRPGNRYKASSSSEWRHRNDLAVVPAKRRKVMSSDNNCDKNCHQPESSSSPKASNLLLPEQEEIKQEKLSNSDSIDLSAKLLEPDQLRRYCQKLFTFVEEARYFPKFCFLKKRVNRANNSSNGNVNVCDSGQGNTSNDNTYIPSNTSGNNGNNKLVAKSGESGNPVSAVPSETSVSIHCTERIKVPKKNIYIDLAGRNFNCILNMYCQNAFGITPTFKASSSLSGIHDFEVICEIGGTSYAVGEGKTKKIAKQKAVSKTLEILIPGFFSKISTNADKLLTIDNGGGAGTSQSTLESTDGRDKEIYAIFDNMDITDPRVFTYSTKLNSITPYNILIECMNRHCVLDSNLVSTIGKSNRHNVYKMKLGDKEVQANCENKREGRQLASQYMMAELHPHIQRWGGILRLYGPDSKPVKRFDMHEMQNLLLEDRGGVKSNLINLLRRKMLELSEEWQSSNKSYAKFKVPFENIPIIVFHPDSKDQLKDHIKQ